MNEKPAGGMDLFSALGSLVGMVASGGNPMGAALGGGLGTLIGGGSLQDAFQSGVGSLFTGATLGKTGVMFDVLGQLGGGGGSRDRGASLIDMFTGGGGGGMQRGPAAVAQRMMGGGMGMRQGGGPQYRGVTGGISNLLDIMGVTSGGSIQDPILAGLILDQITRPKPAMSGLEQRQYATGERVPDYRGTPVPNVPRISYRAQGGYIQGPGTGTSDSIPAMIYQNGGPVQEARLSDGEFVMTERAVRGAGGGDRDRGAQNMYRMMNRLERRA
jgi:hypothetical protein